MVKDNGCLIAKENRVMICNINKSIDEIKVGVMNMSNHYSKRIPNWAVASITTLSSLSVGLIVKGVFG